MQADEVAVRVVFVPGTDAVSMKDLRQLSSGRMGIFCECLSVFVCYCRKLSSPVVAVVNGLSAPVCQELLRNNF